MNRRTGRTEHVSYREKADMLYISNIIGNNVAVTDTSDGVTQVCTEQTIVDCLKKGLRIDGYYPDGVQIIEPPHIIFERIFNEDYVIALQRMPYDWEFTCAFQDPADKFIEKFSFIRRKKNNFTIHDLQVDMWLWDAVMDDVVARFDAYFECYYMYKPERWGWRFSPKSIRR